MALQDTRLIDGLIQVVEVKKNLGKEGRLGGGIGFMIRNILM